jgi:adenine-specific DNA-methyltransferase
VLICWKHLTGFGLTFKALAHRRRRAKFIREGEGRLAERSSEAGRRLWWFRRWHLPDGRKTLVVWRKLTGKPEDNRLDEWFTGRAPAKTASSISFVNGGNNLERSSGRHLKVRLIDEDLPADVRDGGS